MNSSERALQTDEKLFFFFKFQFRFQIIGRKPKKYSNHMNIDQSAMYYISMDLTQQGHCGQILVTLH